MSYRHVWAEAAAGCPWVGMPVPKRLYAAHEVVISRIANLWASSAIFARVFSCAAFYCAPIQKAHPTWRAS